MLQLVNFVNTIDVTISRLPTHTGTYRMAAKPDLDDGFLMLAHELDAALAVADFTKGARIVLREVFAQIFGMTKSRTAVLSPSGIAEKVGVKREFIVRAVRELVDSNVLEKTEDGSFRFLKDYESWLYRGEPRLTKAEAIYCQKSATKKSRSTAQDRNQPVPNLEPTSSNGWNQLVPKPELPSSKSGTNEFQNGVLPYRNAGAEFDKGEEEDNTPLTPQGGNDVVKLSIPQEDTNTPRSQRQSKATPEEVNALIAWAKKVIGDRGELEFYFQKLAGWACSYPIDWIEAAVLCTAAGADSIKPGKLAPHTNKCLINWHPNGPPRDERATADRQRGRDQPTAPLVYEQDDPSKAAEYARIERSYELSRKRNEEKRKCG